MLAKAIKQIRLLKITEDKHYCDRIEVSITCAVCDVTLAWKKSSQSSDEHNEALNDKQQRLDKKTFADVFALINKK